jgi:hypothetical protein
MLTDLTNRHLTDYLPADLTDIFKNIICQNEVSELTDLTNNRLMLTFQ